MIWDMVKTADGMTDSQLVAVMTNTFGPPTVTDAERLRAADRLDAAADVIDVQGWCQNELVSTSGGVCALGAIQTAAAVGHRLPLWSATPDARQKQAQIAMMELGLYLTAEGHFTDVPEVLAGHVPTWNDDPVRTKDDVTDTLRRAAKNIREQVQK